VKKYTNINLWSSDMKKILLLILAFLLFGCADNPCEDGTPSGSLCKKSGGYLAPQKDALYSVVDRDATNSHI